MQERDWYSIVEDGGGKFVHYHGWSYYHGEGEWSFVDLTGCCIPVSELVESGDRSECLAHAAEMSAQYQGEHPEDEAERMLESYYGTVVFSLGQRECFEGTRLPLQDLTMDTPCGEYWF